jgi:uncharacterized protein (DUF427 family)
MENTELENVWDYPRPAICQAFAGRLRVEHAGALLADTNNGFRTLETSHPPTYYIPPTAIRFNLLRKNNTQTFCEWKGVASYFDLVAGDTTIKNAAWVYHNPTPSFIEIKDHLSFYASKVDACFVNDEQVQAQDGDFYGGWITANLTGPFKGSPGTSHW